MQRSVGYIAYTIRPSFMTMSFYSQAYHLMCKVAHLPKANFALPTFGYFENTPQISTDAGKKKGGAFSYFMSNLALRWRILCSRTGHIAYLPVPRIV